MFRAIFAAVLLTGGSISQAGLTQLGDWGAHPPATESDFAVERAFAAETIDWLLDPSAGDPIGTPTRTPAASDRFRLEPQNLRSNWQPVMFRDASPPSRAASAFADSRTASWPTVDSRTPVAVPLPPAVMGGIIVGAIAVSRRVFSRRRRWRATPLR